MKKLALVSTILVLCQCALIPSIEVPATLEDVGVIETKSDYVISLLDYDNFLYSFNVEYDRSLGKAFIANHTLYSVKHIYTDDDYIDISKSDLIKLGTVDIHGLNVCEERHKIDDTFYALVQNGFVKMFLRRNHLLFYEVNVWPPIIPGDSGSPVLCESHQAVVGSISSVGRGGSRSWIAVIDYEKQTSCTQETKETEIKED